MPSLYRCENNKMIEKRVEKKCPPPKPPKPPGPPKPPKKKKKLNFKTCKKNTINSLYEVEHFLRDFKHISKYIKLYKVLK